MKVRTLFVSFIILLATAGCGLFDTPEDPEVIFRDGKITLQSLESYRFVTELEIGAANGESQTLRVEGKQINDPLSQEVQVVNPDTQALFAHWIRKADSYWIYDPASNGWTSIPRDQAEQSLASISYIIPADLWNSVNPNALDGAEFIGDEEVEGRATAHYRSSTDDAGQVLSGIQLENADRIDLDAWFDTESDVPVRTRVLAAGAGAEDSTSIEIVTTLQDLNSDEIAIDQPEEEIPTLGAGTSPRLQSLADGTELPVHPDAEETLGQISDEAQPFVQQFDQISRSEAIAVQVYTAPVTVEELESYFMKTLEGDEWTFDQRASSGPEEKAVSMTFKRGDNNTQVILIPMENGRSLIITALE